MTTQTTCVDAKLRASVEAYNRAARHGKAFYAQLAEIFAPLVGTKVLKADGSLVAKASRLIPKSSFGTGVRTWKPDYDTLLCWTVDANVTVDGTCVCIYQRVDVHVGDIRDGVLIRLREAPEFRDDYTLEEIAEKREIYFAAKRAADDARSDLSPFGEYDR